MIQVLFLTDAHQIGGSETYLKAVLPRLQSLGIRVGAALPLSEGNRPIREALQAQGVPVFAYRRLEDLPPANLWVASAWYPQNLRRFLQTFPKVAVLVHDQVEVFYPLGGRYLYRLGYRLLQVPNLRRAPWVITVSHWAARWLQEVHGIRRVATVPNGVDPGVFRPPFPEEKEALRARLGLTRPSVLAPARMSPEKNHLAVLLTARLLPGVDFLLVGRGELLGLWRRVARTLGLKNVRFLGGWEDMPELYRAADAFFLPTLGENQSLATLEAMASGLPVVTTPIPAQAELIRQGEEGLLIPPRPTLLAQALARVLQDPGLAQGLGQRARARVLKAHTLEGTAQNLGKTLSQILEEA